MFARRSEQRRESGTQNPAVSPRLSDTGGRTTLQLVLVGPTGVFGGRQKEEALAALSLAGGVPPSDIELWPAGGTVVLATLPTNAALNVYGHIRAGTLVSLSGMPIESASLASIAVYVTSGPTRAGMTIPVVATTAAAAATAAATTAQASSPGADVVSPGAVATTAAATTVAATTALITTQSPRFAAADKLDLPILIGILIVGMTLAVVVGSVFVWNTCGVNPCPCLPAAIVALFCRPPDKQSSGRHQLQDPADGWGGSPHHTASASSDGVVLKHSTFVKPTLPVLAGHESSLEQVEACSPVVLEMDPTAHTSDPFRQQLVSLAQHLRTTTSPSHALVVELTNTHENSDRGDDGDDLNMTWWRQSPFFAREGRRDNHELNGMPNALDSTCVNNPRNESMEPDARGSMLEKEVGASIEHGSVRPTRVQQGVRAVDVAHKNVADVVMQDRLDGPQQLAPCADYLDVIMDTPRQLSSHQQPQYPDRYRRGRSRPTESAPELLVGMPDNGTYLSGWGICV